MKVKPMYWIIIALNIFSCGTAQENPKDQTEAVVNEEPTQSSDSDSSFLNIDYLTGKFEPSTQEGFIKIETAYSDGSEMWIRKDAYEAFLKMHEAAKKDGIHLKIISAARNFNRQKQIWEAKWTGARLVEGKDLSKAIPEAGKRAYKILEYSSMPGTSRHHWGTDIDLNNLEPSWFKSGEGAKIYAWLSTHAADYGFCQPYTKKGESRPHGYNEEHWHWSYQPVASKLTEFARQNLKNEMISGFKGSEAATEIDVVGKYVLGIGC
jgi:LAS superfamily LD-carboxypeptidase LdcB